MDLDSKIEIILSTNGSVTVRKGDKQGVFSPTQLYKILDRNKALFNHGAAEVKVGHRIQIDVPGGKKRKGEDYMFLVERIKDLGFSDKVLEQNILDLQRKGVIEYKWRKNDMVHLPSFFMEASEGEIHQVLNFGT